jgi:hypothetical protein
MRMPNAIATAKRIPDARFMIPILSPESPFSKSIVQIEPSICLIFMECGGSTPL